MGKRDNRVMHKAQVALGTKVPQYWGLRRFVSMRGIFQLPVALCFDFYYEMPSVGNNSISKKTRKDKDRC